MKEKFSALTGAVFSLPWCCIIPGIFAILGLAGVAFARSVTAGIAPYLLAVSIIFLGRAHYLIHIKRQGSKFSHVVVWLSTLLALTFWAVRWRLFL